MDKVNGFIPLAKQIQNHWLWTDKPFARGQAWIDLIIMANFEDRQIISKGVIVKVERGQVFRTVKFLSERWGWTPKKVRKFIEALEGEHMVTSKGLSNGTLITIENYAKWNDSGQTKCTSKGNQNAHQRATKGSQNNNNNNDKKNIYKDVPEEIKDIFMEWVAMRKEMKKPITSEYGVTRALNKLNSLSKNPEKQRELIGYAIYKNWLSFYPIPQEDKIPKPKVEEQPQRIKAEPMPEETRAKMNALGFGNLIGKE